MLHAHRPLELGPCAAQLTQRAGSHSSHEARGIVPDVLSGLRSIPTSAREKKAPGVRVSPVELRSPRAPIPHDFAMANNPSFGLAPGCAHRRTPPVGGASPLRLVLSTDWPGDFPPCLLHNRRPKPRLSVRMDGRSSYRMHSISCRCRLEHFNFPPLSSYGRVTLSRAMHEGNCMNPARRTGRGDGTRFLPNKGPRRGLGPDAVIVQARLRFLWRHGGRILLPLQSDRSGRGHTV